jgi:hypothetical protein
LRGRPVQRPLARDRVAPTQKGEATVYERAPRVPDEEERAAVIATLLGATRHWMAAADPVHDAADPVQDALDPVQDAVDPVQDARPAEVSQPADSATAAATSSKRAVTGGNSPSGKTI